MIYLAISYICNQSCSFCPCGGLKRQKKYLDYSEIISFLHEHSDVSDKHVVISGGEPTLHPDFAKILLLFQNADFKITVLSTSERFSNPDFTKRVFAGINTSKIKVITTLHSHRESAHEQINKTKGSFWRSIHGLKAVEELGCKTVVKHCITRENYRELKQFYHFVCSTFSPNIDMQLCSIDYCEVSETMQEQAFLSFPMIKEYLEDMLDDYFVDLRNNKKRKLYCLNMPLCAAEPYYWGVFQKKTAHYFAHLSPNENGTIVINNLVDNGVSVSHLFCKDCMVKQECVGTYHSAFDIYGGRMVEPYY